jgi:hypothetical protein
LPKALKAIIGEAIEYVVVLNRPAGLEGASETASSADE